ncbi:MAG: 3-dehydroquinate synthase [Gammaproteobacteria bacterium]|nr:3-dehydroquinate synthase [Gammaproteobacteria bacterium]
MTTVVVELGSDSYPILIEPGLTATPERLRALLDQHCVVTGPTVVIVNDTVWSLFGESVSRALGRHCMTIKIADGEQAKSLDSYHRVITRMLDNKCTRDCRIIALGGGITGDLAGFVAATYMRGITYVQMPTTLLAQVDSSVGGKTAVNHALAKNCIGAFKQPKAVLIDPDSLVHLDDRQLRAGLAEVLKYAFICDEVFCGWLEQHIDDLLARDSAALQYAIELSCRIKAGVVAKDALDLSGERALLNLGHTFGHALEKTGQFNDWLHGEAVACGMVMAAQFSSQTGRLSASDAHRLRSLVVSAGLPVTCPKTDPTEMIEAMRLDKKNSQGRIRLVLLDKIGKASLDWAAEPQLESFIRQFVAPAT